MKIHLIRTHRLDVAIKSRIACEQH